MAGQGQRLNIVPTVTMHGVMKARLIGATGLRGATPYSKRGATRRCLDHSVPADPEEDGRHHEDIRFRLMEAKYVAGNNVKHVVLENVQSATLKDKFNEEGMIVAEGEREAKKLEDAGELKRLEETGVHVKSLFQIEDEGEIYVKEGPAICRSPTTYYGYQLKVAYIAIL
ncbi:V-type proton ATPase subunit D-like [Nymphaea colorata]|uniref:V-type proton ATPase subunit D-like n=1 Tax=Nymphaea colorata TaxID=210225 RepID=UPI00129DC502|nr:V-type proton ATPase subunit D-like [Nymphaea colorata]